MWFSRLKKFAVEIGGPFAVVAVPVAAGLYAVLVHESSSLKALMKDAEERNDRRFAEAEARSDRRFAEVRGDIKDLNATVRAGFSGRST
mmetsp:Transcript_22674/g.38022  ORF Transcript_22674/g.38022 Transcript_22674/m.38022 type:complete len:89 (-) Transcript_22674:56-322(-)